MWPEWCEVERGPLGLAELGAELGVEPSVIVEYVELGLIAPGTAPVEGWRFSADDAARLARALRLARELELHAAAAAMLTELIEERDRLRHRISCLERLLAAER